MRSAFRLLKPASYIAPFSPTGLTGVLAHPAPRPALIAIYNTTLTFLDSLPSHSVYRTSTATLTKHRLSIVNSVTPPNYQPYYDRNISPLLPNLKKLAKDAGWPETKLQAAIAAAQVRATHRELTASVPENAEGVDLETLNFISEIFVEEEKALSDAVSPLTNSGKTADTGKQAGKLAIPPLPAEPSLTSEQVAELEAKLEAGLIEEVLSQGIAEMRLVKELLEYQPWEQLEEEPVKGQWDYFSRKGPVQAA